MVATTIAFITAHAVAIAVTTASVIAASVTAAVQTQQQNAQIEYQKSVLEQNKIAAQNKAAAEMRNRQIQASRQQAATRAKMAATGVDSTSGSFLDLVGQGAAAGEMDVLKAKYDGDADAWALNNKINELNSQKQSVALNAGMAGLNAGLKMGLDTGLLNTGGDSLPGKAIGKTSGNSGFKGMDAMEGTVA